jgi:hypothetical protein
MNAPEAIDRDRLFRLFGAAADGSLDAGAAAALEKALASSAEARRLWFLHQDLELGLDEWAAARAQVTEAVPGLALLPAAPSLPPRSSPARSARRRIVPPWVAAVAALVVAALGLVLWTRAAKAPAAASLATLTRSTMARWASSPPEPGAPILSPRLLDLADGMIELDMSSGARVVFEGPGRIELLTGNSLHLASGRLHATVPPQASGFTIEGNGFSLVDHGTEFGCVASAAGGAEVHVFEGSVELKPSHRDTRWLSGHQAVVVDAAAIASVPPRRELFVTPRDLDRAAADPAVFRQQAGRMLREHPAALVYFQGGDLHDGRLSNAVTDAPILARGCALVAGREPGRRALAFDGTSSQLSLSLDHDCQALTLVAWVRLDDPSRRQDLVAGDGPLRAGEVAWYSYLGQALGFGAHVPLADLPGRGWRTLHGPVSTGPPGTWRLLATVADAKAGSITHFVDGKLVAMSRTPLPPLLRLGPLLVGSTTTSRNTRRQNRHFRGAIDEFALIAAPLSADEIARLHQLGRPLPATAPP